jgi:uncharacterized membrane protein YgcG
MNRLLLSSMVLAASWPAWAAAESQVIDRANMFTPAAKERAEQLFRDFQRRTKVEIVVETISNLQGADPKLSDRLPPTEAERVLTKYSKQQAAAKGIRGLYILICRDPEKLKYESSRNSINPQDTQAVVGAVMSSLKNREFDQALMKAADVLQKIEPATSSAPPRVAKQEQNTLSPIWTILLIGLGIWLVVGLMRGLSGAGTGGGFFPSMLGGLFGGMAGMWMYDSFFRGGGGFSGGDGYDGGSSGGGDWGGGDSGGGDWGGGGDYGASGDF